MYDDLTILATVFLIMSKFHLQKLYKFAFGKWLSEEIKSINKCVPLLSGRACGAWAGSAGGPERERGPEVEGGHAAWGQDQEEEEEDQCQEEDQVPLICCFQVRTPISQVQDQWERGSQTDDCGRGRQAPGGRWIDQPPGGRWICQIIGWGRGSQAVGWAGWCGSWTYSTGDVMVTPSRTIIGTDNHNHYVEALWCSGLCCRLVIRSGLGFGSHSVCMPLNKAFVNKLSFSTQV